MYQVERLMKNRSQEFAETQQDACLMMNRAVMMVDP
jgi:hypothetical protein